MLFFYGKNFQKFSHLYRSKIEKFLNLKETEDDGDEPLLTVLNITLMLLIGLVTIALGITCFYFINEGKKKSGSQPTRAFKRLDSESNSDQEVDDLNLTAIQANSAYFNEFPEENQYPPSQLITVPNYQSKGDRVFL